MVIVQGSKATFRFLRPQARTVFLSGSFNLWRPQELPMSRSDDGFWTAVLDLAPGEYAFRYYADGQWFVDYAAFGLQNGPWGMNGVVRITEPPPVGHPRHLAPRKLRAPSAHHLRQRRFRWPVAAQPPAR